MAVAVALVTGGCVQISPAEAQAVSNGGNGHEEQLRTLDLVQVGKLSGLSVSPDQEYAVVRLDRDNVERNETDLAWFRIRLSDGRLNHVCDAGDPLWDINGYLDTAVPQWSIDGKWIYFRRLEKQQVQVWRCSADGAQLDQVTAADADVQDFILDKDATLHVALAGATRAEILEAEGREYDAGVLMDQTTIPGFPIVRSFPHNGRMATYRTLLPRDYKWGRRPLLGDRPLRIISMRLPDRTMRSASPAIEERFSQWWSSHANSQYDPLASPVLASPDGSRTASKVERSAALPSDHATPRSSFLLQLEDRATGLTVVCNDAVCTDADDLSPIGWTSDGSSLVMQTTTFGTRALHLWQPTENLVMSISSSEKDMGSERSGTEGPCRVVAAASSLGEAICLVSGADSPPQLIAIDLATGRERNLFDPNEALRHAGLGVARKVLIADRWGGETYGRLILPQAWLDLPAGERARLPLVITSYTCAGFLTGGSGGDVPEHVLASLGYAAICIDSSGYAVRSGPGFRSGWDNNDRTLDFFEYAVSVLDRQGVIDPRRVTVTGFSASASTVTYALFKSTRFTSSIITTQGYLDPITCYLNSAQGLCRTYNAQHWSLPYDGPAGRFSETSPASHVSQIQTPLLMQLPDVEYQAMMQLHSAMLDYDRPVEMYVFPDEYHNKRQPRHRLAVYDRNIDWIEFWLKGLERESGDARQYERWRSMRLRQCELFIGKAATARPWYCQSDESATGAVAPAGHMR